MNINKISDTTERIEYIMRSAIDTVGVQKQKGRKPWKQMTYKTMVTYINKIAVGIWFIYHLAEEVDNVNLSSHALANGYSNVEVGERDFERIKIRKKRRRVLSWWNLRYLRRAKDPKNPNGIFGNPFNIWM